MSENNLEQIKHLNLTEKDFQLIVEGLDSLPEKGVSGDLMMGLIGVMITKDDPESQAKLKKQTDEREAKRKRERDAMIDDIKILQGKLLMLKRYLQENKLLQDAYEILSLPK